MPKIELESIPQNNATGYPSPFNQQVRERWKRRLGPVAGLTEMGATHTVLKPGAWSSQRHWHDEEDELLVMLSGEAVLVEDDGRTVLRSGDICAWPKGSTNGHHIVNESNADCSFIAISAGNSGGTGGYSDIDMQFGDGKYFRKDGTPYEGRQVR